VRDMVRVENGGERAAKGLARWRPKIGPTSVYRVLAS
jgi:hypothetical protein